MRRTLLVVACGAIATGPVAGQDSLRLDYGRTSGASLRLVTESIEAWTLMHFPGLPDSVSGEAATFLGETRRIAEVLDGATIVETIYDSARVRFRIQGLAWQSIPFADVPIASRRALIDESMVETPMAPSPLGEGESAMAAGLGRQLAIQLPANIVRAGDGWDSELRLPYTVALVGDTTTLLTTVLYGESSAMVDSVVPRQTDTLAYVTVTGRLDSRMVASDYPLAGGPAPVEVWGVVSASLLWSTGWRDWVSGAMAARIHHRIEAPAGSGLPDPRLVVQMTTRFRVRP